jgi:hypothetical protein
MTGATFRLHVFMKAHFRLKKPLHLLTQSPCIAALAASVWV